MSQSAKSNGLLLPVIVGVACLALAGGLYAFFSGDGKPEEEMETAAAECVISDDLRTKLTAASVGEVAAFNVSEKPTKLPAISFKDGDGTTRGIDDWSGRTVLMNLWATWCAPCRKEMPDLQALDAELGGDSFEVVAVSVDQGEPQKPKDFYNEIGLDTLGFYHDGTVDTLFTLKQASLAFGLPATLLIDGEGCVLGVLNGPALWAGEDAKRLVRAAM
ncbi:TlpA disulfide reductase family protein [Pseudahrensia aquimaris]|uniref:TlpA disulfide reductase family protein n=1 Tax=Pseudahrensia aquimaris TaxID=744461 RepID=A0ABW3FCD3_9HYPH